MSTSLHIIFLNISTFMFEQFNILDFVADDNTDSISSSFYMFEDVKSYYCCIH